MKKVMLLTLAVYLFVTGCSGIYKAELDLLEKSNIVMNELITRLDDKKGEEAAEALERFTDEFGQLQPRLKAVIDKHPEWKQIPPDEVKSAMDEFKKNFDTIENKLMAYTAGLEKSPVGYRIVEGVSEVQKLLRKL